MLMTSSSDFIGELTKFETEAAATCQLSIIAMRIFNIFKRQKHTQPKEVFFQASATLYPDKIVIETIDRVKEGFGISSMNISSLPVDTDINTLGSTIRLHLNLTKTGLPIPKDYKQHYKDFLDKAGFKNGKEHHENALLLNISQRRNKIFISPTKNGGYSGKHRGFLGIKDSDIVIDSNVDNSTLADKIKYGWTKCECS